MSKMTADEILALGFELCASDVHITVDSSPAFRLCGEILPLDAPEWRGKPGAEVAGAGKLKPEDTDSLIRQIMTSAQYDKFQEVGELDYAYAVPGLCHYRINAFKQRGCVGFTGRLIGAKILSFRELGLPDTLAALCRKPAGLVLVTGPAGSGKSTTLASMIDLINTERRYHIITLEDPIEFVHRHKKSLVHQREIGKDTCTYASALRAVLRQDPDVILFGEMRDPETIGIAITAAETGHLVFGTLHTANATQAIDRIIDAFSPYQQQQIRAQLSITILGIVAQTLIPRVDKPGRVVATEVMIATPAIRNLIREGKTHQIAGQIQTGARYGMQSLDADLRSLCLKKVISKEDALDRALDPETLMRLI